jgi:hypothetical protein
MTDTIFIIPYRNREKEKEHFISYMKTYLEKIKFTNNYRFIFAHQCDQRPFNRGAMKNIGFLAMKKEYPDTYKDITFIFHDVDTLPSESCVLPYKTTTGKVAHYYGTKFALGGIFAIKGEDFEKTGGFPNFWGWGLEDNVINDRSIESGLEIDRSIFFNMNDTKNIMRSFDGFNRIISKRDTVVYKYETPDTLNDIKNINYKIENNNIVSNNIENYVNISSFDVKMNPKEQVYENYDIRRGSKLIVPKGYNRRVWNMNKMF